MKTLNDITYPVYRKYLNELSWFCIESPERFIEVRKLGSRFLQSVHEVKILPDRNLIYDLVLNYTEFAVEIDAAEFEKVQNQAQ